MKKEKEYKEKEVKDGESTLGDAQKLDTKKDDMYSDDVQFENEDENVNVAAAQKRLRERLRACEAEKKEYLDGWQRMRADFANARKEEDLRRGELVKFASEGLVEDVLPVLDSFTIAFGNKEAWGKVDENWRKGVEYIYAQLFSILEARGLSEIGMVGEKLDPRLHLVMETVETDDPSKGDTVSEVIQKGYRLHNKVIRPSKVKSFGYTKAQ